MRFREFTFRVLFCYFMTSWRDEYVSPDASSGFERTLGGVWVPPPNHRRDSECLGPAGKTLFQFPKFLKATNKSSTGLWKRDKRNLGAKEV